MKLKSNEEFEEEVKNKQIVDSEIRDCLDSKGAKACVKPKKMLSAKFAKLNNATKRRRREGKKCIEFHIYS